MADGKPDIAPYERAIERLKETLARYQADISDTDVRDSLVHRFEFTYELSPQMLKRYLEYAVGSSEKFNTMAFPDLIRTANEHGLLLGDWLSWKEFRKMRGKTSHSYDEKTALEVVAEIPQFLEEAAYLRDRLRERLA